MSRGWKHILGLLLVLGSMVAHGQEYDELYGRNPWNGGINRAGLRQDSLSLSYAEVWGGLERGGMTNHSASEESYTLGVRTESMRHFERLSFAGGFSFDYFDGRDMWGSMSMRPGYWPVDIYEYTPGRKVRERYAFEGGLSADFTTSWRGGLWVDFMAGNYAKRKDLRHKNTTMDFAIAPSVQWHRGKAAIGVAYLYEKHSERIEGEEIGSTPDSYLAFLDKGLFYGVEKLWTSNEIHLDEAGISAFAIKKQLHGAALDIELGEWYAEVRYRHTTGESGEKGSLWHQFSGDDLRGRARWQHTTARGDLHRVEGVLDWEGLDNREVILSTETQGGVTIATIYGSRPIYEVRRMNSSLYYGWWRGASFLKAGGRLLRQREGSSLLYPLSRSRTLRRQELFMEGCWATRVVELSAGAEVGWGSFDEEQQEGSGTLPTTPYPKRQQELCDWQNAYLTSLQAGAKLALRVWIHKGFYADLEARYAHAFEAASLPQPNRIEVRLAVGCRW